MQIDVSEPAQGIRAINLNDGDKNIFSLEAVERFDAVLREIEASGSATTVIISGTEKALSVGLDTATVLRGDENALQLIAGMRNVLARLYLGPLRSVVVSQGHATAAGAMLLLVADHRIGIRGSGKTGLSEVRFGLEVPPATRQLVRDRISPRFQYAATAGAALFDSDTAREAGFVDEVADSRVVAMDLAHLAAQRLQELGEPGYLDTKRGMRRKFARIIADQI